MSDSCCPNCGATDWSDKEDHECRSCGYKKPNTRRSLDSRLLYCSICGCHHLVAVDDESLPACPIHGPGSVQVVKH